MTRTPLSSPLWDQLPYIKECRSKRMGWLAITQLLNERGVNITSSGIQHFIKRVRRRKELPAFFPEDCSGKLVPELSARARLDALKTKTAEGIRPTFTFDPRDPKTDITA